jgi:integrase/recombinase XerD
MASKRQQPMAASAKVIINSNRQKKDGTAAIYLQVIIYREIKKINLDVSWYPKYFKDGVCLPLPKGKESTTGFSCKDTNLILSDAMGKATEIFVQFRLRRVGLCMDSFLRDYATNLNKDDFIKYMEWKIMQRLKDREIEQSTKLSHDVTLRMLIRWKKFLLFSEFDDRTALRFDKWMEKFTESKSLNGRWGHHRNFKTYLNLAKQDRIDFLHPYDYYKAKASAGRHQPLTKAQFLFIWLGYQHNTWLSTEREAVRAFLFCCLTGMRHGDVRRMDIEWIDGEFFNFVPIKTKKTGTVVRVPTTKESLDLVADEMMEVGESKMFSRISEQKQNLYLREIGKEIGLKHNLCFQVARETFATLYMEHDGKLEVLASFMGHTSTKMSEKYVKIRDQRKTDEKGRISEFIIRNVK